MAPRLARRCHRDQGGSITFLTVFAALVLTFLLGMVLNVGRQVDGKLRMQNAADAAAYSGGLVLARAMNSLAFTNRLLCEVFAMTSILREGHERNSDRYVPDILAAWKNIAVVFQGSSFPKFQKLGAAIPAKADAEQTLVTALSSWMAALADGPPDHPEQGARVMVESILSEHWITKYQTAIVLNAAGMAQEAATTVATDDGKPNNGRGTMTATLWRMGTAQQVSGDLRDWLIVDPNGDPTAAAPGGGPSPANPIPTPAARRNDFARDYLKWWNDQILGFCNVGARMSEFGLLWQHFTCGQLQKLEQEYSDSNLPFALRPDVESLFLPDVYKLPADYEAPADQYFTFLGVTTWPKAVELIPGLFQNPIPGDSIAFAECRVLVPTSRLVWVQPVPPPPPFPMGGAPRYQWPSSPAPPSGAAMWQPGRQPGVEMNPINGWPAPQQWNLFNQHWTCQLVPAGSSCDPTLASTEAGQVVAILQYFVPGLSGLKSEHLQQISYH